VDASQAVGWTPVGAASAFSGFAAILAGLVFGGIVVLLSLPPRRKLEFDRSRPLALLTAAFFSLAVAAFLFASLSGERPEFALHTYVEAIFPSAILSLGVVQVSVSLVWLFEAYGVHPTKQPSVSSLGFIVHGTVLLSAVLLAGLITGPIFESFVHPRVAPFPAWILIAAVIGSPVPLRFLLNFRLDWRALRTMLTVSVALGLAAAAGEAYSGTLSDDDVRRLYETGPGGVLLAAVLLAIVTSFLSMELLLDGPSIWVRWFGQRRK
jgi:hypothetical protein